MTLPGQGQRDVLNPIEPFIQESDLIIGSKLNVTMRESGSRGTKQRPLHGAKVFSVDGTGARWKGTAARNQCWRGFPKFFRLLSTKSYTGGGDNLGLTSAKWCNAARKFSFESAPN